MNFNQRWFNQIELDLEKKILTKRSQNKQKLIEEIEWYLALPKTLQYVVPRICDYSVEENNPWIQLEHVAVPAMDQVLFSSVESCDRASFLKALHRFLTQCSDYGARSPIFASSQYQAMDEMYLQKTFARIASYEKDPLFHDIVTQAPVINGRQCLSLAQVKSAIIKWVNKEDFQRGYVHAILHGDLSFSNILFDASQNIFRVVDPRGDFGGLGIFGDLRYDLAKLLHCSHGHYDFYVNGQFLLEELPSTHYQLHPVISVEQQLICDEISAFVKSHRSVREQDLLFIEGLLFLSMIPLHSDRPQSQKAFLLNGLSLMTEALSDKVAILDNHKAS